MKSIQSLVQRKEGALHDDATAYAVLVRFSSALEEGCESKALDPIKARLPKDLDALFSMTEAEINKKKAVA